jgi:hypothetical protein
MKRMMPRHVVALALLIATSLHAFPQNYPSRPVKIVVPTAPGGAIDTAAVWWARNCLCRLVAHPGPRIVECRGCGTRTDRLSCISRTPDGKTAPRCQAKPDSLALGTPLWDRIESDRYKWATHFREARKRYHPPPVRVSSGGILANIS